MFDPLFDALPYVLGWQNFLAVTVGVLAGIFVGALPGLSATMAISILIPFTFGLEPLVALGLLAGIYNGTMYGGAIPAILLRIPGTPAAVATSFDGYPMALAGKGGEALQVAVISSAIGGIASALALMLLSPPLAMLTLQFGPAEIFWVAMFGLTSIIFLLGPNIIKGLLSACMGILLSLVGLDTITGSERLTFDRLELIDGIHIIVLLVGLYALPPAINLLEGTGKKATNEFRKLKSGGLWRALPKILTYWRTWLRGSLIGIVVGILPGAGGSIAAFLSYNESRRSSKTPDKWGKGEPEGVAAAETANNADTASSMIPALTLGIPGTPVAAVVLGGMLIHGLQPGPMLFREHPDIVFGFMWQFLFAAIILMFLGGTIATNSFAQVLRLPRQLLGAAILVLMVVGVYSINERMFDVYLMFSFGIVGYFMEKLDFPLAPAVLGLILGEFAEMNLRIALRIGDGHWSVLWSNSISKIVIALIVIIVIAPIARRLMTGNKQSDASQLSEDK